MDGRSAGQQGGRARSRRGENMLRSEGVSSLVWPKHGMCGIVSGNETRGARAGRLKCQRETLAFIL